MKTTQYRIKDTAGRGFLAVNASTSFDLPRNWVSERKARVFPSFADASAHAQAFFRRGAVEIVAL